MRREDSRIVDRLAGRRSQVGYGRQHNLIDRETIFPYLHANSMGAGSLKENICSQPTPSVVGPTPTVIYGCTTGLEHHRGSRSCPNAMDRRTSDGYAIRKLGIYRIIISGFARGFTVNPKMVCLGVI